MSNEIGGYLNIYNIAKDILHIAAIYGPKETVANYKVIEIFMFLNCKNWSEKIISAANEIYQK